MALIPPCGALLKYNVLKRAFYTSKPGLAGSVFWEMITKVTIDCSEK